MKTSCLITGATGFLGNAILQKYPNAIVLGRSCPMGYEDKFLKRDLSFNSSYTGCFDGIEAIIHCAARVHVMDELSCDPLRAFRLVNVEATINLAKQAAIAGVKRFIFISTIKVCGEFTAVNCKYSACSPFSPEDPYAVSKYEAELSLMQISKETGMELVIIRPPLIYGPGVKGNFLNLLKLCKSGLPLPFGAINNLRSMVYLGNVVDLIIACIDHPKASGKIFLASDGKDVSLRGLLSLICKAMQKPAYLIPLPVFLLEFLGKVTGKSGIIKRLIGNLQVDNSDAKTFLGWEPPYSLEEGIQVTVDDFLARSVR